MKKIIIASVCAMAVACGSLKAASSPNDTRLNVLNNWNGTVHVEEGASSMTKKSADLSQGGGLDWKMYFGKISSLTMSYMPRGTSSWQPIPGCPNGDYSFGLKVMVYPSYADPNVPRCELQ